MTLIELSICVVVMALAITIVSMLLHAVHESYDRTGQALGDVATASRLLDDLKADLRRARSLAIAPDRIDLEFETGLRATWSVTPAVVKRDGDGPAREYEGALDSLALRREGRMAAIELELRRRNPASEFRPRISAAVFLRNLP
jgi:hypothetical protein